MNVRVVDDASPLPFPDDWLNYVTTYQKHYENKGYTATVNTGLQESEADVFIIANDDLEFSPGDLDRFFGLEDMVIASPSDTAASPDDRFGCIWGMTRKTYKKLGPLNEQYRHFFSDRDYYDRAQANGVRIEKWYDVVVKHVESATYNVVDKETLYQVDLEVYGNSRPHSPVTH